MHSVTKRRLAVVLSADAVGYSRLMTEDEVGTNRLAQVVMSARRRNRPMV
jgi:class 3 adenylate cyclase